MSKYGIVKCHNGINDEYMCYDFKNGYVLATFSSCFGLNIKKFEHVIPAAILNEWVKDLDSVSNEEEAILKFKVYLLDNALISSMMN